MQDGFPKRLRLSTPKEQSSKGTMRSDSGGPAVSGAPDVDDGRDYACEACGFVVVKNLPPGYMLDVNLECSACKALSTFDY